MQANSYYTPRGSQGFAVHHDTHDVLVLQVAGEKRWLLYDPLLELPLKHQRYSKSLGDEGEPTDDLVLRAGDTLYLPRGWLHQAETSDTDSLHLTDRDQRLHVARRREAALGAARGGRRTSGAGRPDRREADELAERLRARLEPEEVERRRGGASSTRAGRSARTASRSSARSSGSTSRRRSSARAP